MKKYIESGALLRYLNDIWLTATPTDTMSDDERELAKMRCEGIEIAMEAIEEFPAADAIEELSAKATPKRVGFAGWKGCRDTRYKCPYCKKNVRNDETYCHKCGQALMFPRISFTPYVPGEKQELIVTWPDEPPKEETT